jgi:hypothetical protein
MNQLLLAFVLGFAAMSAASEDALDKESFLYILKLPKEVASDQELSTYKSYPNFKAFAVELVAGKLSMDYAQRTGNMRSQRAANDAALLNCEIENGNDCILYYEGSSNVLHANLSAYHRGKLKGFLNSRIDICKKYGFQPDQIGTCVQNAVNKILDIPTISKEQYQNQQSPKIAQMQRQKPNYNWNAITNLGKCIGDGTCWPSNPKSTVRPVEVPNQRPSCKYSCGIGGVVYTNDFICPLKIFRNGEVCQKRY